MVSTRTIENVAFVDLSAQHLPIADEINAAIAGVIERTDFILGPAVSAFESEFADYCAAPYAIGIDSGTSALELLLRAYGIGQGDEVIVPANTFIATALSVSCAGAMPVLVDIEPHTYNLDPTRLEAAITLRTKAIIPVHLYGQPADMDPILEIATRRGLHVFEDAAQGHGSYYKGRRAGNLGAGASFSFYPAKNLGAYGDGGAVTVPDAEIADRLMMLRNYGQRKKYHHTTEGYNRRLDTLQAAVLRVKLPHLDRWNNARRERAQLYNTLLAGSGVVTPSEADYAHSVWHLYVIRTADRAGLQHFLAKRNIASGIHYPIPIHVQESYRNLGYAPGSFPITEQYAEQIVSLPMYAELPLAHVEYVAEAVREFARACPLEA